MPDGCVLSSVKLCFSWTFSDDGGLRTAEILKDSQRRSVWERVNKMDKIIRGRGEMISTKDGKTNSDAFLYNKPVNQWQVAENNRN